MAKKTSKAEMQRLAKAFREQAEVLPEIPARAAAYIENFVPAGVEPEVWEAIRDVYRQVMRKAGYKSDKPVAQFSTALGRYLLWRHAEHLDVSVTSAMRFDDIDRFYVRGLDDSSERTRNDYRSRLRLLATRVNPSMEAPVVTPLGYNSVRPGYTTVEEATMRRVALRQRLPETRRRLCAVVGLGGGAGLDPVDMRTLRAGDITETESGLLVATSGAKPRQVIVRRNYEELVRVGINDRPSTDLVLSVGRDRANQVSRVIDNASIYDDCPKVDMRRLRTTWITWLIQQRVPLATVLKASGLSSARTIVDMVAHLDLVEDNSMLRDGGAS